MLGFDALGKLALGQLPEIFTNFFSSLWSQPQPKKQVPESFKGFIFVPVTTPVVFGSFSQPLSKITPRPSDVVFRILRPTAATTGPLVFTRFSEPSFIKKVLPNQYTEPRF